MLSKLCTTECICWVKVTHWIASYPTDSDSSIVFGGTGVVLTHSYTHLAWRLAAYMNVSKLRPVPPNTILHWGFWEPRFLAPFLVPSLPPFDLKTPLKHPQNCASTPSRHLGDKLTISWFIGSISPYFCVYMLVLWPHISNYWGLHQPYHDS